MMSTLDALYRELLKLGFVVMRQASEAGDLEWLAAEIELLHNVPSLIEEKNPERHEYFWQQERKVYLEWVLAPGRELQRSRMATYYEPVWEEMEGCILALKS